MEASQTRKVEAGLWFRLKATFRSPAQHSLGDIERLNIIVLRAGDLVVEGLESPSLFTQIQ
jgi:hypothetical protein